MPNTATKPTSSKPTTSKPTSKPTTSLQRARVQAKAITTAAVAATKPATKPVAATKATKGTTKPTAAAAPATSRFNYNQLVVANPKGIAHKGFFGLLAQLASKPIALGALAAKVQGQVKLTSTKAPAFVCRVRTRHAFTRLGVLVAAK